MAKKKVTIETLHKKFDEKFDALARIVEKGFASADKKFTALAGDVPDIRETMVTKDDLAASEKRLDNRIDGVEKRLDDRVDGVIVKVDGVQNTLDRQTDERTDQRLPARVGAIEKHLGMKKEVVA